jgi:hypothetical protein
MTSQRIPTTHLPVLASLPGFIGANCGVRIRSFLIRRKVVIRMADLRVALQSKAVNSRKGIVSQRSAKGPHLPEHA